MSAEPEFHIDFHYHADSVHNIECRAKMSLARSCGAFIGWSDPGGHSVPVGRPTAVDGGALAGVPFAVKDNIETRDLPTSAGTYTLRNHRPHRNASAVQRLIDAGARLVGKTNMHELGLGVTSDNGAFGPVRNPFASSRSAGGSSGGSAVAVATGAVPFALGTDTGGSVRIPAAFCGVVGFRPTMGRYGADGLINISWTRDTIGILARTVAWIRQVDSVLTEQHAVLEPDLSPGLRIGVPGEFWDGLDSDVTPVVRTALEALTAHGIELVTLPSQDRRRLSIQAGMPIIDYETEHGLEKYLASIEHPATLEQFIPTVLSPDVRQILEDLLRRPVPRSDYEHALEQRRRLQDSHWSLMRGWRLDGLIYPTVVTTAPPLGNDFTLVVDGHPRPLLSTIIANATPSAVCGTPSISIPAGLTRRGLPVGLTIEGLPGCDRHVLQLASRVEHSLEQVLGNGEIS